MEVIFENKIREKNVSTLNVDTVSSEGCDFLIFAAHPDDIELSCGGSVIKLTDEGYDVVIADATQGEAGSRGTKETRKQEAIIAAKVLGIRERVNLHIPDGKISVCDEQVLAIVQTIRHYKPRVAIFPPPTDRHPDHEELHKVIRHAVFKSGLTKYDSKWGNEQQTPHRPSKLFHYMQTYEFQPDFFVDITDVFDRKVQTIEAYGTQFTTSKTPSNEQDDEPQTFISRPEFSEFLVARARYFGEKIGVRYAEAFGSIEPIGLHSLSTFLKQ